MAPYRTRNILGIVNPYGSSWNTPTWHHYELNTESLVKTFVCPEDSIWKIARQRHHIYCAAIQLRRSEARYECRPHSRRHWLPAVTEEGAGGPCRRAESLTRDVAMTSSGSHDCTHKTHHLPLNTLTLLMLGAHLPTNAFETV